MSAALCLSMIRGSLCRLRGLPFLLFLEQFLFFCTTLGWADSGMSVGRGLGQTWLRKRSGPGMRLWWRRNLSEILLFHVRDIDFHRCSGISRYLWLISFGYRSLWYFAIIDVAMISASSCVCSNVWAGTGEVLSQVLVIETATITPFRLLFGIFVVMVMAAFLQLLMIIGFASHDLIVVWGQWSLIAFSSALVAHIVAPVSISVMTASRGVGGLLSAVIF